MESQKATEIELSENFQLDLFAETLSEKKIKQLRCVSRAITSFYLVVYPRYLPPEAPTCRLPPLCINYPKILFSF